MNVFILRDNLHWGIMGVYETEADAEAAAMDNYAERYPGEEVALEKDFDITEFEVQPAGAGR